jgi:hypothetical protein
MQRDDDVNLDLDGNTYNVMIRYSRREVGPVILLFLIDIVIPHNYLFIWVSTVAVRHAGGASQARKACQHVSQKMDWSQHLPVQTHVNVKC